MFVLMTLALTALLGALALGTDVAVIYFNWMQLRKAADSAALAGAAYLGPFSTQGGAEPSCNWGGSRTPAYDVACSYAEQNGVAASEIVSIGPATVLPPNVTVPPGAETLQISLRRSNIPIFFARLVMPPDTKLGAAVDAIAIGPAPIQTISRGMFPAGMMVMPSPSEPYPQSITLSASGSGANFVWLDLPSCNPVGSAPPANFHGKGAGLATAIASGSTCAYSVGQTISVVPPSIVATISGISDSMSQRISIENAPPPALTLLNSSDPQVTVVPLVHVNATTGPTGNVRQTATVNGFATLWLSSYADSSQTISGDFMQFTAEYGVGGAETAYGAYSIPYLID
jgi:hypothetical protein